MRERLQVGEVAEVLGITPTAVRYYHEIGLVPEPERSEGDYRLYEAREVSRLERVRRLRSLDLSIEQVRGVLDDSQGGRERLEGALASQLEDISARLLGLEERRELIGRALAEDDPESFLLRGTAPQLEELEAAAADSETTEGQRRFRAAFRTFRWPKELLEGLVEMHRFQSKLDEDSPETARRDGRRQSGAGSAQETGQAAGGGRRSNPDYVQISARIHRDVRFSLEKVLVERTEKEGRYVEMAEVIEDLMRFYLEHGDPYNLLDGR